MAFQTVISTDLPNDFAILEFLPVETGDECRIFLSISLGQRIGPAFLPVNSVFAPPFRSTVTQICQRFFKPQRLIGVESDRGGANRPGTDAAGKDYGETSHAWIVLPGR